MKIEDFFKNTYVQTRVIENEGKKVVVKCYTSSASFKWYLISPAFRRFPYTSDPLERMNREINFFTFNWRGHLRTPKIIDFDQKTMCVYREFIEGTEITTAQNFFELGKALSYIHENNFALGDTKIENFIYNYTINVVDAEQSIQTDNFKYFSWDLLVLAFSIAYKFLYDVKSFYENYLKILEGYEPTEDILRELLGLNSIPLLTLMPFTHYNYFKKAIEQFL